MITKENQLLQFGLCLNNEGYTASLEVGKVYCIIPDEEASVHGYIRVIDESGEDYAYTDNRFHLTGLMQIQLCALMFTRPATHLPSLIKGERVGPNLIQLPITVEKMLSSASRV